MGRRVAWVLLGSVGLLLAVAVASEALAGLGRTLPMPGPTHRERPAARLDHNDDCVACHPQIAAEWARSRHRQAFMDPMFQAAFDREHGSPFCQGCHAPEADPRRRPDARRAELGVGCVSCHLVGDEILAGPAPERASGDLARAPHPIRREAAFAGPDACAGCHEFWFPSGGREGQELMMQRTVSEHARSPARRESCQRCHMPPAGGGRLHLDHSFAVDPRMLRAAVRVEARRTRDEVGVERAIVRLEPRAAGHAFPTGDLFRRVVVRVEDLEPVYLARQFGARRLGSGAVIKIELADERVELGPRELAIELPARLHDRPVRWSVAYQRVLDSPPGAEQLAELWDETPLASGQL